MRPSPQLSFVLITPLQVDSEFPSGPRLPDQLLSNISVIPNKGRPFLGSAFWLVRDTLL